MKQFIILICFVPLLTGLTGCYKDKGNYDYSEINEISFQGINASYDVLLGETIEIKPDLSSSIPPAQGAEDFEYEWSGLRIEPGVAAADAKVIISRERNLDQPVTIAPGPYRIYYRVKDKKTGVQWSTNFLMNVKSSVYEGFLVLNDVDGHTRLDMLSYLNDEFVPYTDVLQRVGSKLPPQGKPYKVHCYPYSSTFYGIYLLTETGTNKIHPESFDYDITYGLRYEMATAAAADLKATNLVGSPLIYPASSWMYADGNVYYYWAVAATRYGLPVNVYDGGATFPVSPYMAVDVTQGSAILFNERDKRFVKHSFTAANCFNLTSTSTLFDFNIGMDLVYMEFNYSGNIHAVLKNNVGKYFLARFNVAGTQSYFAEITGDDIQQAEHFAVSPELGYLFYSVGGKLYEYDLSAKTSKLMLNKGTGSITYLSFPYFLNRTYAARTTTYLQWAKELIVGSYNPQEPAASAGTLEFFTVPPVNGDLVKQRGWNNFGKVVSVAYRER